MSEFWRHMIGVIAAVILGLGATALVLYALVAWAKAIWEGYEEAMVAAIVVAILALIFIADWGLR